MKYLVALILLPTISALFFGGGDCGCNSCCAPAPPPCAPQPVCPAPAPCGPPPVQSCGCESGGYSGGYAAPAAICPPRYIILQSSNAGGVAAGGSSYSAGPVAPIGGGASYSAPAAPTSYSSGPAPSTAYSEGQSQASSQQVAAPSPPTDSDYSEAAGSASATVSTSTASATSTDHPTYNTNAREYASKTFNSTARCPNVELLHFIDDAIVEGDVAESKRKVSKLLNSVFSSDDGKPIDVICAGSKISYRLVADLSCEHTKGKITCVAYKQAA